MNQEEIRLFEFDWKKWLKIGFGVMAGIFIVRFIIFTLFFNEAFKFVHDFNREFTKGQAAIQNKIEAEDRDFEQRASSFDKTHDRIGRDIDAMSELIAKKHGKQLARQVIDAKNDYESRLIECKADVECQKYLPN